MYFTRSVVIAFLFLFLASISVFAEEKKGMMGSGMMGQGMTGGMHMGQEMMGMGSSPWFHHGVSLTLQNAEKFGLNEKQKKQLEDIRSKYTKAIIRQEAELNIAELDLDKLLRMPQINLAKVKIAVKKIKDKEAQIQYLRIEAFTEARKILTDEQKKKLKELMEQPPPSEMMEGMMGGGMMGDMMMNMEEIEKKKEFSSHGERIYYTGTNEKGEVIKNSHNMQGVGCAMCHGADAKGMTMMMEMPDLQWSTLIDPKGHVHPNGRKHPPFNEDNFKACIIAGSDPAGNQLNMMMPRWEMSNEDLNDLIEYLKTK